MALVGHRGWAVNDMGNVQPAAAVEVRRAADNSLASLFTDDTGGTPVANPFTADSDGSFEFYLEPDRYTLLVGSGASQEAQPLNIVDGRAQVPFEDRAAFEAWVAGGGSAAPGTIKSDGEAFYIATPGDTSEPGLPGWKFLSLNKFDQDIVSRTDEDTGLSWPASNTVALKAGGTEQLRMTNGQATGAAVQSSATDNTDGKVWKSSGTNGAFGLGAIHAPNCDDADLPTVSGLYRTVNDTVNTPVSSWGHTILHQQFDQNNATQLFSSGSGDKLFFRRKRSGTWQAWGQIISDADVQSSTTDTTAGRLMLVRAFGLGDVVSTAITDANAPTVTGFYYFNDAASASNVPPGLNNQCALYHQQANSANAMQLLGGRGAGHLYFRMKIAGAYGPWQEMISDAGGQTINGTLTIGGDVTPDADNAHSCGSASRRWAQVYSATATINTSDAKTKVDVVDLDERERAVAARAKSLLRKFKFKDAVAAKGEGARWHFGIVAQELAASFAEEGLDPWSYGLLCRDEWWEAEVLLPPVTDEEGNVTEAERTERRIITNSEDVPEGAQHHEIMGVRYDELLAFILSTL